MTLRDHDEISQRPDHLTALGRASAGDDGRVMAAANAKVMAGQSFSWALQQIKHGARARRRGWNGKGMFIFLVEGSEFFVNRQPLLAILGEGTLVRYHAHIDMRTATGEIVPWLASQSDLLDDDWELV